MAKFVKGDPRTIAAARKAAAVTNAKRPKGGWPATGGSVPAVKKRVVNHYALLVDASGSMGGWKKETIKAFNVQVKAIKQASVAEGQESYVSLYTFGEDFGAVREKFFACPVDSLKPLADSNYAPSGSTPMFACMIEALSRQERDVYNKRMGEAVDLAFVTIVITDGDNTDHWHRRAELQSLISRLQATDKWTIAAMTPAFSVNKMIALGLPPGNVKSWEQTTQGYERVNAAMRGSTVSYALARSVGQTMSESYFQTDASKVTTRQLATKLTDRQKDFKVWTVPSEVAIKDFVESKRVTFVLGAGYYLLQKRETVQSYKQIAIQVKGSNEIYTGAEARALLNLPDYEVKVEPGNHANYDIFVQSTSTNRKLVRGSKFLYDLSHTADSRHTWAKSP